MSRRWRRAVSAVTAGALAVGLLHGASMLIGPAAASGIDCHDASSAVAHSVTAPAHGGSHDGHHSSGGSTQNALSACPLANIAGIDPPVPNTARQVRSTTIAAAPEPILVSVTVAPPDPPPRRAA